MKATSHPSPTSKNPIDKTKFILPTLITTIGMGWLLTSLDIMPQFDWVWTMGLAVVGLMTFVFSGLDKFSVVVGPFFLTSSVMSILRQADYVSLNVEVPCLVIVLGLFMGIAQLPAVKTPNWIVDSHPN